MGYILVYLSTFLFGLTLMLWVFFAQNQARRNARESLKEIELLGTPKTEEELLEESGFSIRILRPLALKLLDLVVRFTPDSVKRDYNQMIIAAGLQKKLTAIKVVVYQLAFGGLLGGYIATIMKPGPMKLILILLGAALGGAMPWVYIRSKAKSRADLVQRALPDMMDLLYVSVEAGLGFDQALQRAAEKMKGPLSEELLKALDEISKGRKREEALRGVAIRTKSQDISSFVSAVIQTEQLGSNIANMLRVQSTVMRQKRRQRASEAANKLAVKMLFPIVFFIFPPLFIVLLGPAIMRIIDVLGAL